LKSSKEAAAQVHQDSNFFPADSASRIRHGGRGLNVANDGYKKAFDDLAETYVSLNDSAETIIRQLKKTVNAELRSKLVRELRNLEMKRLELLDQMDNLPKSI
jgi:hypothetical protein